MQKYKITFRELCNNIRLYGAITLINELGEKIIDLSTADVNLNKTLSNEILDRQVKSLDTFDNNLLITLEGGEDDTD